MGSAASPHTRFSLSIVIVSSYLECFVAALDDLVGATVRTLKRPFVAVAADEDVVSRFDILRHVGWFETMLRCRNWSKLLDLLLELSEEKCWIGAVCRRADEVAGDHERFAENQFRQSHLKVLLEGCPQAKKHPWQLIGPVVAGVLEAGAQCRLQVCAASQRDRWLEDGMQSSGFFLVSCGHLVYIHFRFRIIGNNSCRSF